MTVEQIKNKFNHILSMVVFGCSEDGQIEYPETPDEYIAEMENHGVVYSSKEYATAYSNGTGWYFKKDQAPKIERISEKLILEILQYW